MPVSNSKMKKPDPFIMNEDHVNKAVANFLRGIGCNNVVYLLGKEHGIDVKAEKNGWKIWVESKGSRGNDHANDIVFDSGQIKTHADRQILKLMEYANNTDGKTLFIMANPNIERIRNRVNKVKRLLDEMQFIQFWVNSDDTILVEFPHQIKDTLKNLKFI